MSAWYGEEWELCNDDGFVYRRRKRRLNHDDPSSSSAAAAGSHPPDLLSDAKRRRARRRRALEKVRCRYEHEIRHWELLSNTLRAMEAKAEEEQRRAREEEERRRSQEEERAREVASSSSSERPYCWVVDELLSQAEGHKKAMSDVLKLCDAVDLACDEQEERLNQTLFDLPIWGSPQELMDSLCDDD